MRKFPIRPLLLAGSVLAVCATPALAQVSPDPVQPAGDVATAAPMQETDSNDPANDIVVTGTTARNRTKLTSSVAITTVDQAQLTKLQPHSLADSLQQVPGLWVEASGGEVSNNVSPRGLSGGAAFSFISLQEDGLPVLYDGELVDALMREDVTIERFEAIRGGTSAILSTNGPAAIINFITRKGTDKPGGLMKLTAGSYNMGRAEIVYGAPLGEDWAIAAGGYFRVGDGVRDIGITADHGGQFRVNLTRKLEGGSLTLSAKVINDHNTFYLPIPLTNPDKPRGIPGVNPNHGTLDGPDLAHIRHLSTDGEIETDLSTGFHVKAAVIGADFQHELGGNWSFRNNGRYTRYDIAPHSVFNGPNSYLVTAANRLDPTQSADVQGLLDRFGPQGAVRAALTYADTGELIADPSTLNGNGFTTDAVAETRYRSIDHFIDKLTVSNETDRNSFTAGLLFAAQTLNRDSDYGARIITEVKTQPRRLDIVAVDAADNIVGYLSNNGVLRNGYFFESHRGDSKSYSLFANDEFQLTPKLRVDGGIRYENVTYHVSDEEVISGPALVGGTPIPGAFNPDGTDVDNIIANNFYRNAGTGNFINSSRNIEEISWTAGFNYKFSDRMAVYGRYASGVTMPTLYSADSFANGASRLNFAEVGARYYSRLFTGSATLYRTQFNNLSFGETDQDTGLFRQVFVKTFSTGLELEGQFKPARFFSLEAIATLQHATIGDIDAAAVEAEQNGNQVLRTPNVQVRLIPTVYLGPVSAFLVFSHVGKRYADFENTLKLPAYQVLDAGAQVDVARNVQLSLKVNNITNSIGLTEGNPRSGFNQSANGQLFYARPVLGRNGTLSVSYKF